jgi:integrase/recombinase XerC
VNQALAAVELLYAQGPAIRIGVARARVARPGEPDALTAAQEAKLQRAADRRGVRDAAIIALLRYTGARVEECARLDLVDVAITARTGTARLHGKGDQVRVVPLPAPARDRISTWIEHRPALLGPAGEPGLWVGQRGRLTAGGITEVVLAAGADAGLPGLRPHRLRHTYATRLRQGGADPAQIQALMGHASIDTTARYFRAGPAEVAGVIDRIFEP